MTTTPDPKTVRRDAAERVLEFMAFARAAQLSDDYVLSMGACPAEGRNAPLTFGDLRMLLTPVEQPQEFECEVCTKPITAYPCILCEHEPDPWKKPEDEQPQDERDGDVRAVARLKAADRVDFSRDHIAEWMAASEALFDRFADRIAALDARDATERP